MGKGTCGVADGSCEAEMHACYGMELMDDCTKVPAAQRKKDSFVRFRAILSTLPT